MRTAFIDALAAEARRDPRVMLVTGDLGFGVFNTFMDELAGQFVNAGVAEQNMTGMAAGMALSGLCVFTYSIANFPVIRALEQIRNDICYHDANVKVVAVGGGMAYGSLGPSHHATEDLAVMRAMPNLLVLAPGDPVETRLAVRALVRHHGPAYLRLGRAGEPVVHRRDPGFEIGRAITVRDGDDVTLISTGGQLHDTTAAARVLADEDGVSARVLSMHTLRPLDEAAVLAAARETGAVFTIEEHSVTGGLGSAVAEVLMEADERPQHFRRIGLRGGFSTLTGDQEFLRAHYSLDTAGILQTVRGVLAEA